MAIRFTINGINFEVDTTQEALEMASASSEAEAKRDRKKPPVPVKVRPLAAERDAEANVERFVQSLSENGMKLVEVIVLHPDGIGTDDLAKAMGMETLALPPIIRHVKTMATRANLNPEETIARKQVSEGGKPKSVYTLGVEVMTALEKK